MTEELRGLHPQPSIKKAAEFRTVYSKGTSAANHLFVMYKHENGLDYNRIGISVSKKVGNSVVRHRIKRLVRECLRLNGTMFNTGLDIIVIARGAAKDKGQEDVSKAVMHLAKKMSLLVSVENAPQNGHLDEA